jgi:hypothetical protein
MDSKLKRMFKATFYISEPEKLPENDPVEEILLRRLTAKTAGEALQRAEAKITASIRSPSSDPLLRLIQAADKADSAIVTGVVPKSSSGPADLPVSVAPEMPIPDPVVHQARPPAAVAGQASGSTAPVLEKSLEAAPLASGTAVAPEPARTLRSVAAASATVESSSRQPPVQIKEVKAVPKKKEGGDMMDIFLEEDKKEKNEALSEGLDIIPGQQLLEQAEAVFAALKLKRKGSSL